jgi:hypothetical protein
LMDDAGQAAWRLFSRFIKVDGAEETPHPVS